MSETNGLPVGWCQTILGNAAEIHDDLREPVNAEERAKRLGWIPYYGATGQVGWIDDYLMDGEYVLLGEDGAPFFDPHKPKAYRVEGKAWVNNHAHVLRGIDGAMDNRYLTFALNHTDYRGFANGTTRLKLTQAAMRRLPIRLAPLNEQRRIVAKIEELFSDLDAGVAALERIRANLKRYRAAVLKAAVEGKLSQAWRAKQVDAASRRVGSECAETGSVASVKATRQDAASTLEPATKLLERILTERRQKWEQTQLAKFAAAGKTPPKGWREKYIEPAAPDTSALPELPQGWCWARIEQLLTRSEYGTSVKCDYGAIGPPVLRIPNIAKGQIDLDDMKQATVQIGLTGEDALQKGDLLMCRTNGSINLIGKAALVRGNYEPFHTFASYLLRFRFREHNTLPKWVHLFLTSSHGRLFIEKNAASSAGQHNISLSLIHTMLLPLPPLAEQSEIAQEVESRLSIIEETEAQINANLKRAAHLRQSILKRAFEGKLVPQDPSDEPAEKLLERIKAERIGKMKSVTPPRTRPGRRVSSSEPLEK